MEEEGDDNDDNDDNDDGIVSSYGFLSVIHFVSVYRKHGVKKEPKKMRKKEEKDKDEDGLELRFVGD